MAACTATMRARFAEPRAHFSHTPISRNFSRLLGALAMHIEAERDIEDAAAFDPAFLDWHTDAEGARDRVLTLIANILEARPARREDIPLQRLARMTAHMVQSTDTDDFQRAHDFIHMRSEFFSCPGIGVIAHRVRQMLSTATARLHELASLADYVDPIDMVDLDPEASAEPVLVAAG